MMCALVTPACNAVTHASTFGSIPAEMTPDFTISLICPTVSDGTHHEIETLVTEH